MKMVGLTSMKKTVQTSASSSHSKLFYNGIAVAVGFIIGFCFELLFSERLNLQNMSEKLKDSVLLPPFAAEEVMFYMKDDNQTQKNDFSQPANVLVWQDDNTLLDIDDFQFLINNKTICNLQGKIVLILIASHRSHFEERRIIRLTYGSATRIDDVTIRIAFLLGEALPPQIDSNPFGVDNSTINSLFEKLRNNSREENDLILMESYLYGDIILGNFMESPRNESYRHLMGYKWCLNFCPNAHYVLKVEDNVFLNLPKLFSEKSISVENDLMCNVSIHEVPVRDPHDVSWVSKMDFEGDVYPHYCPGWFYGASIQWMYKIYSVSLKSRFLWIDDIFVSGILRQRAQISYGIHANISDTFSVTGPNTLNHNEDICSTNSSVVYIPREEKLTNNFVCLWNHTNST